MTPAIVTAIELAWYTDMTAVQIGQLFRVTKWRVYKVWAEARAQGRLLPIRRDEFSDELRRLFIVSFETRSQASIFNSIPPFTTQAPARVMKEVA